jgi:hypothetical protein
MRHVCSIFGSSYRRRCLRCHRHKRSSCIRNGGPGGRDLHRRRGCIGLHCRKLCSRPLRLELSRNGGGVCRSLRRSRRSVLGRSPSRNVLSRSDPGGLDSLNCRVVRYESGVLCSCHVPNCGGLCCDSLCCDSLVGGSMGGAGSCGRVRGSESRDRLGCDGAATAAVAVRSAAAACVAAVSADTAACVAVVLAAIAAWFFAVSAATAALSAAVWPATVAAAASAAVQVHEVCFGVPDGVPSEPCRSNPHIPAATAVLTRFTRTLRPARGSGEQPTAGAQDTSYEP